MSSSDPQAFIVDASEALQSETTQQPPVARPESVWLPRNHPQRLLLNNEVHARPSERLASPARVSYMALLADSQQQQSAWDQLGALAKEHGILPPEPDAAHYTVEMGGFRLKAERHTEFVRFKFIAQGLGSGGEADPFAEPAISLLPPAWLASLPGELLVATHVAILSRRDRAEDSAFAANGRFFERDSLMGAALSGGAGSAFTDLRIRDDGFGRLLIMDHGMTAGQIGRALQRLLEMDTYRMLALLAYPVARALVPALTTIERQLSGITTALVSALEQDEPALLERLTRLAAQIESRQSETLFRFAAATSYYELVQLRIRELREERVQGLPTFKEFTERRLAPAMNTCRSVTARQEALSVRVAQATELLSTRVNLSSERQSHALLASMDRRAQLQIRLQETVEGLSVAAVTYYIVGLVGHAAEGLTELGLKVRPGIAMAVAIPVVVVFVAWSLRKMRRRLVKRAPSAANARI